MPLPTARWVSHSSKTVMQCGLSESSHGRARTYPGVVRISVVIVTSLSSAEALCMAKKQTAVNTAAATRLRAMAADAEQSS